VPSQHNIKGDYLSRVGGKVTDATLDVKNNLFYDLYNKSRHTQTCWRLHDRPMRDREGHSEGVTRPRTNHTSIVEAAISTLDPSSTFVALIRKR
jgi:hypothetical protein